MLQNHEVVRVYALNRGAPGDFAKVRERQAEAFKMWGLDESLLASKVSFHTADLTLPYFGLDEATFVEMRGSVTAIVHNAWRVDFNVSLPSFEPLIAGARKLLDFALESAVSGGPRVLFVSSISAIISTCLLFFPPALHYTAAGPVPETLDFGPEVAVGLGYGESKWVTEQLFGRAAKTTGLRTTAVRVGQLSGDTRVGGWNVKEWVPAIVRGSQLLGCVPEKDDVSGLHASSSVLLTRNAAPDGFVGARRHCGVYPLGSAPQRRAHRPPHFPAAGHLERHLQAHCRQAQSTSRPGFGVA
ncbi:hypothetical protein K466DRAFT_507571 [Polyporus arcularius HHB13444]|uniref:Thioester reductase (TE) domain-containing protein n=1 Tax=Polyporus arcularius HHB13444 TaxID=1314778 RepID=A0A5C3NPK4_9APHY|nr:hypothetical protein K466DRAFT_507571 [Polyporus arcularius HHB13444]